MNAHPKRTPVFWSDLGKDVSERVETALRAQEPVMGALIASLREIEGMARRECNRRDTIQIIESGRRLLGDKSAVGPKDGPFSFT